MKSSTGALARASRSSVTGFLKQIRLTTAVCSAACLSAGATVAAAAGNLPLDPTAPLTPATAAQVSQNVNRPVIVVMKNLLTGADAASDRAPLMGELSQVNAQRIKTFKTVNSFAATVSEAEVARLQVNPSVAMVVPDVVIRRVKHTSVAKATAAANLSTSLTPHVIPGACGPNGEVLLDPEALQTTHTASNDPQAQTARALGFTGAGVKVAYIADGIDPNNINFIRKDGKSAFIDYQDFTGDGPGQLTDGGEAFLDANSIAGQGIHVYDVNGYSAQPDPGPCNIRIEGMAPGASIVGLNVFGTFEYLTESNFLEAIEYAVVVDHVDVLNESFGGNPYPDVTSQDITKLFNDAAVDAGVTVTVSSGDSGNRNTIGSPASDPKVIAVGASTTDRAYLETNYAAARYFATTGWLNDNISSLSSGGFSETGATVDLVAPGEEGFASCDPSPLFSDCTNDLGQPSSIEEIGGTSESAPLTAGAAALVIEAYRKYHGGASPSPALVKRILTSTATDLGVPAIEQGSGLVNSYKAVLLAESINPSFSSFGKDTMGQLVLSQTQLNAVGAPGTHTSWPVTITNTGAPGQFVQVSGRTFGGYENTQTGTVTLTDGVSPEFANYSGVQNNYAVFKFRVPGGADRLNASIAYPGDPANGLNARVRMILIDPLGRFAAHSLPQGVGNYGSVDVREPVQGNWTGVIFGDVASADGTNGSVPWKVSTQRFVPFASVSPSAFYLAPGRSQIMRVSATTASTPGDSDGSIVISSSSDGYDEFAGIERNSIPVTLRSLIDVANGGAFQGVLTGGNGRDIGQNKFYEFEVGPGHSGITADVSLTNDVGDAVGAYLINPDGVAVGFGQNSVNGVNSLAVSAFTHDPVPGTWTLIVNLAEPVVGDETSQRFTGSVTLDGVHATAPELPNSPGIALTAGVPVVIPVKITNNGAAPEQYFIDARLNAASTIVLPLLVPPTAPPAEGGCGANGFPLPLGTTCGDEPEWFIPTQTSSLEASATATLPIEFDLTTAGDPDIFGAPTSATTAAAFYQPGGGTVEPGLWFVIPSEIGPYPGPAPAGVVNASLKATTKPFDAAVSTPQGDIWTAAVQGMSVFDTFAPLTINPGKTGTFFVTITPTGPSGTVVRGTLYIDDYVSAIPPYAATTGDEVAAFPYSYTIR